MCNLSDLVIERGIEQGIERGIESGIEQKSHNLAQMMIREAEPTDKIMRYTGYSPASSVQSTKRWVRGCLYQ